MTPGYHINIHIKTLTFESLLCFAENVWKMLVIILEGNIYDNIIRHTI